MGPKAGFSNCDAWAQLPVACGILPDQGSNEFPLHWQVDSHPLCCQRSLLHNILNLISTWQSLCPSYHPNGNLKKSKSVFVYTCTCVITQFSVLFLSLCELWFIKKISRYGTSMVVQWLRLHAPSAEGQGWILVGELRPHRLQLRPNTPKKIKIKNKY